MSPYRGFMADLLEEVAGGLGVPLDGREVGFEAGAAFVDPRRESAPQRGPWMRTEAGWVRLGVNAGGEGGPE